MHKTSTHIYCTLFFIHVLIGQKCNFTPLFLLDTLTALEHGNSLYFSFYTNKYAWLYCYSKYVLNKLNIISGPAPLPPPKPAHLTGKLNNNNICSSTTNSMPSNTAPKLINVVSSSIICNTPTSVSVTKTENDNSIDTLSFQEDIEPLLDPKKCEIKPGKETTIEITKERIGLGLSIVGGSDTPLVSNFYNFYFFGK